MENTNKRFAENPKEFYKVKTQRHQKRKSRIDKIQRIPFNLRRSHGKVCRHAVKTERTNRAKYVQAQKSPSPEIVSLVS